MTTIEEEKRNKIKSLVVEMLNESHEAMIKKIDKVLNSGAIDVNDWNEKNNPIILPKIISLAILKNESLQYEARGTSYESKIRREVKNIQYFI